MHHDRRWRQAPFLNVITYLLDHIEVQRLLSLGLVRAVAGADRGRKRIAFSLFDELDRLLRVSQTGVPFIDFDILFNTAQHSQFGFHADAFWEPAVDHPFCDCNVLVERLTARVDHDRAVKARVDAVVAGFFISMIEMNREDASGYICWAVRIMPSSMRLSAYFLAPFESWMMNGARLWTFPSKRPSNCSMLLML